MGSPPICGCLLHCPAFLTAPALPGVFTRKHCPNGLRPAPPLQSLASHWPVTPKRWATWGGRWVCPNIRARRELLNTDSGTMTQDPVPGPSGGGAAFSCGGRREGRMALSRAGTGSQIFHPVTPSFSTSSSGQCQRQAQWPSLSWSPLSGAEADLALAAPAVLPCSLPYTLFQEP